jgi:hypothetical protein
MALVTDGMIELGMVNDRVRSLGDEEPELFDPFFQRLPMALVAIDQMMRRFGPPLVRLLHNMAGLAEPGVVLDVIVGLVRGGASDKSDGSNDKKDDQPLTAMQGTLHP